MWTRWKIGNKKLDYIESSPAFALEGWN